MKLDRQTTFCFHLLSNSFNLLTLDLDEALKLHTMSKEGKYEGLIDGLMETVIREGVKV